jgi:hypothetical protein
MGLCTLWCRTSGVKKKKKRLGGSILFAHEFKLQFGFLNTTHKTEITIFSFLNSFIYAHLGAGNTVSSLTGESSFFFGKYFRLSFGSQAHCVLLHKQWQHLEDSAILASLQFKLGNELRVPWLPRPVWPQV